MPVVRILGRGRAGSAVAAGLTQAGWRVEPLLGRADDPAPAAEGVDLLVLAVPDAVIAAVARSVSPVATTVVAHLAGSLGLDVLAPHPRRAAVHPLRAIPAGATSLRGAWFAIAGDPIAHDVVDALGGHPVVVADADRATYHAAAVVASNHLVALLAQVDRLAVAAGVPLEAFLDLARGALDGVARLGPAAALTGPVARGDWDTVARHLAAIDPSERPTYEALMLAAARLAGREDEVRALGVAPCR